MRTIITLSALLLITFTSCRKVINVKLNSASSQYVIIGNVTNMAGPYSVSITKTIDFQLDNNFPAVSGAVVIITDATIGNSDTLQESAPGIYNTSILTGQEGHTYNLYIKVENEIFTASSTMPAMVPLDSLYQEPATFGDGVSIVPVYRDPAGVKNYYHTVQFINNKQSKEIFLRSDILTDGQVVSRPLDLGTDTAMHTGDNVRIELQAVDSAIYQYYRNLVATINQNSAAPANPQTNITGAKLGYFSAHAISASTITLHN